MIKKSDLKIVSSDCVLLNRRPADFIFDGKEDATMVANILFGRMQELGGVGLSANQVGLNIRMFVMGTEEVRMNVFNPEIIEFSLEEEHMNEGCLSYPGLTLGVKRPSNIKVKFQNDKGEWCELHLGGMTARIFQHEYDHMEGKSFLDHVSPMKLEYYKKKLKNKKQKLVKKYSQKVLRNIANDLDK